ncbi:MAG: hypothetical protein FWE31_00305 [Firmicutes bacterium]|nr:hypothetical protein [Bacillota bacterium]
MEMYCLTLILTKVSHFGIRGERIDLIKRHKEKVGIKKFLELNKLDDDLNLGRFLHLYTDWAYYNKMFDDDYLRKTTLANFDTNHLYTIVELDKGIKNKYGILYGITSMEKQLLTVIDEWNKKQGSPKGKLLFSQEELLAFIEMISNIDLLCPVFLAGLSDCDTHDF